MQKFYKKNRLIFYLFVSTLSSCEVQNNERYDLAFSNFYVQKSLNTQATNTLLDFGTTISATNVFLTDNNIAVANRGALDKDSLFHEFSVEDKKLIRKFVGYGKDFGQIYGPMSVGYHMGQYYVHDITLSKILLINTDRVEKKEYNLDNFAYSIRMIDTLSLIRTGYFHAESFLEKVNLDDGSSTVLYNDFIPLNNKLHINAWKSAYEGFLFLRPDNDKAIIASRFTDLIRIYDIQTGREKTIWGPDNYLPNFHPMNNPDVNYYSIALTNKTRLAFIGGDVTQNYIYLLYSGKLNHESDFLGHRIFVYDWDGNPHMEINIDRKIKNICVSDDDNTLYAIDQLNHSILKFENFTHD